MSLQIQLHNAPPPYLNIQSGVKTLRGYQLNFSLINFNLQEEVQNIFPRIGYLVCNLFIGESLMCRFLNYSGTGFYNNRLYITGLFSKSSLLAGCNHRGKGYAFKIHPVLGYHFLKIPMTELVDRQVMVSDVFDIQNGLLKTLEQNERIESIDNKYFNQFLRESLPDKQSIYNDPIYHAVNTILVNKGNVKIKKLATAHCMSERTLRRQFLLKVGLSPQAYARILKMQHAMEWIRHHPMVSLAEIAFRTGYYDVAHLAHDFKHRIQIPPSMLDQQLSPLVENYLDTIAIIGH